MIDHSYDEQSQKFFISKLIGKDNKCNHNELDKNIPCPIYSYHISIYNQKYTKTLGKPALWLAAYLVYWNLYPNGLTYNYKRY